MFLMYLTDDSNPYIFIYAQEVSMDFCDQGDRFYEFEELAKTKSQLSWLPVDGLKLIAVMPRYFIKLIKKQLPRPMYLSILIQPLKKVDKANYPLSNQTDTKNQLIYNSTSNQPMINRSKTISPINYYTPTRKQIRTEMLSRICRVR